MSKDMDGLAEPESAKQSSSSKSLTLAQELRGAISGVIFGSIELKFSYFLDHDDTLRQNRAQAHLDTLLKHLDDKLTELTDLQPSDSEATSGQAKAQSPPKEDN